MMVLVRYYVSEESGDEVEDYDFKVGDYGGCGEADYNGERSSVGLGGGGDYVGEDVGGGIIVARYVKMAKVVADFMLVRMSVVEIIEA